MPLYWGIAVFVAIVVGVLMTTDSKQQQKTTKVKDQFEFPTASGDRLKPKLYGTRWITGANVIDYGKYSTKPIWSDEVYDD